MDTLDKKLTDLPEEMFPPGLHGKIMRRVAFLRFRTPFLITLGALLFNVTVSGWRFWTAASEDQIPAVLQALFGSFEMSASFAADFLRAVYEAVPIWSLSIFLLNAFLAGYIVWLYLFFKKRFASVAES